MKVLICKEQHIKLPDFNDILAPVLWHQIGALCSLRFVVSYMQIWHMQQLVPTCQWSFLIGWRRLLAALPKRLVKSSQAGRMLFYIFCRFHFFCSRNQFTIVQYLQKPGHTKIVGWSDMNIRMKRMNWYCRHASFEQPNWEQPFRVNVRGDRVRAALRPSALSLEPTQTAK